jgi:hypothetical protein
VQQVRRSENRTSNGTRETDPRVGRSVDNPDLVLVFKDGEDDEQISFEDCISLKSQEKPSKGKSRWALARKPSPDDSKEAADKYDTSHRIAQDEDDQPDENEKNEGKTRSRECSVM